MTVSNTGKTAPAGTVTVRDFLPRGLTATAVSGAVWNCSPLPATVLLTCTRSDALASGSRYPLLLVTVNVLNATPTITNTANVTCLGDLHVHSLHDTANVITPTLAITQSHTGDFYLR